jgi:phosphate transport system substrate-binding protein
MRISWLSPLIVAIMTMGIALSASATEVTWTGCGITKLAFMSEIATAYEKKTGIPTKISAGGATKGIRAVAAGTSDLGGTCRPALQDAQGNIHPEEKNATLTQVAWDALVVIVHPDNPVDNIALADLKKVFEGAITSWKELGGPEDKRIALVTRDGNTSGVGHMFRRLVFNNPDYEFQARSLKEKSTGPLEKKIEKTVTGMGIDGISSAKKRKLKFLKIDGVAPTKENIASGSYSLFRPLFLASGPKTPEAAKAVIEFVLSPEGQAIISKEGTVNLAEGAALTPLWNAKKKSLGL